MWWQGLEGGAQQAQAGVGGVCMDAIVSLCVLRVTRLSSVLLDACAAQLGVNFEVRGVVQPMGEKHEVSCSWLAAHLFT